MILNSCYSHRGGVKIPDIGGILNFAGYDWILVHINKQAQEAYFITKDIIAESDLFVVNSSASLADDDIRMVSDDNSKLAKYCTNMMKSIYENYKNIPFKAVNIPSAKIAEGKQAGIFIPCRDEHIKTFDYFKIAANLIAKYNGVAADWWIYPLGVTGGVAADSGHFVSGYYTYWINTAGKMEWQQYWKGTNYCTEVKGIRPMCCVALDGLPYILKNTKG